ncbi:NPC intracellular cholesterol transporter 2-like [Ochlerotatus camptorhynchus]|uniref:NPC intracellular cholesterol transporter 2-like n=1 Tax=Ochlerotatus camptorhynchus TaxID=644619 RepID=UPI0031D5D031
MFKLLLIVALVPAILAQTPVRQCANGAGLPQSVDINGCTTSPCPIQNGAPIQALAVGITSPVASNGMEAYIVIRLAGLQIPFPMPDGLEDACAMGTAPGTCPISVGQVFDYNLNHGGMALTLTGVTVQVEVGLRADDNSLIGCLEFDATIV